MPSASAREGTRRCPRWAWFAAMCVALGLVTSVGVAWGIAWNTRGLDPLAMLPLNVFPKSDGGGMRFIDEPEFTLGTSNRVADLTPAELEALWLDLTRIGEGLDPKHEPNAWSGYRQTLPGRTNHVFHAEWADSIEEKQKASFYQWFQGSACKTALWRHAALASARDAYFVEFCVSSYGWPWRGFALERACTQEHVLGVKANSFDIDPALPRDPTYNLEPLYHVLKLPSGHLPTFPLWPGLLANTAFYGGAWAVAIFTPLLVRRWLRARKGGCRACGYSREGLKDGAPCPGCGRGV